MAELIELAPARGPSSANAAFVHGLGGDRLATWTNRPPGQEVWPKWLAQDIEGLAVFSVGYEAPVSRWSGTAMHLTDRAANVLNLLLVDSRLREGQLILIGHSLGGLLIKQMLRTAAAEADRRAEAARFIECVEKVVFLGTPHTGADLAGWGDRLRILARPSAATNSLVRNDPNLRDLNQWYRGWARERGIDHLILTETKNVHVLGMIVKPDSGDPGLSSNPIPIDADHITIAKPANRDSEIYLHIRDFVERRVERPVTIVEKKVDAVKDDTKAIRENVDRLTRELSLTNAQKEALVADLAGVKTKYSGTVELVSGFLETMVGRSVAPEQFAPMLFKIASDWKKAGEKIDAFSFSTNLSPDLSVMRDQAKAAHGAGRLDEAERLLARIAADEIGALARLEAHEQEVQAEIQLRRRRIAETKATQAAVTHARLNYREAAVLYGEAAGLVESFDAESRNDLLLAQAGELSQQGDEFGDNAALFEAIGLYRQCLDLMPRERVPLQWAAAQNNLGNALRYIGERENEEAVSMRYLEEAVAALREALEEYMRQHVPLLYAETQNNLGAALMRLGERENGTAGLEKAVAAFREALKELTRERVPLDWARAQSNLGDVLRIIGERENDEVVSIRCLEEAVAAFREALEELTHERVPLDWAHVQNNLGVALMRLGQLESEAVRLMEAIAAFRAAGEEQTRERVPLDWAMTMNNSGLALSTLGELMSVTLYLEGAVAHYRAALEELTIEDAPYQHGLVQRNLARAQALLASGAGAAGE